MPHPSCTTSTHHSNIHSSLPPQYIRYLEENEGTEDEIRSVYHRACVIHLREKFRPHLSWAAFEEEKGISEVLVMVLLVWLAV